MPPEETTDSLRETPSLDSAPASTPALIDALYREEVLAARRMSPEEKLLAGEELFDYACSITLAGIRNQFPNANEAELRRILETRLELQRKLEGRA